MTPAEVAEQIRAIVAARYLAGAALGARLLRAADDLEALDGG